MGEDSRWIPPLRAGRRPAGAALLGWLDDERAPRLCRVSGARGAGKSHLLAWLVRAGTAPGTPTSHRVHTVLPAAGVTVRGAVWMLGRRYGVVARSPRELLAALAEDERRTVICVPELGRAVQPARLVSELLDPLLELPHVRLLVEASTGSPEAEAFRAVPSPAVLDLDEPQWTDRDRFASWCAEQGADAYAYPSPGLALGMPREPAPEGLEQLLARVPVGPVGSPDLTAAGEDLLTELWTATARTGGLASLAADPLLHALAGPLAVTAALEEADSPFAQAWDAAGPALIEEADPAVRVAVLRTRLLGPGGDAPARSAGGRAAGGRAAWAGHWADWRSGPAVSTAVGAGPSAGRLLLADVSGAVRTVEAATGRALGQVAVPGPKPLRGLAVSPGGSVILLDVWGGTELVPPAAAAGGLEPYALAEALAVLRDAAAEISAVAVAAGLPETAPAVGDAAGAVHRYENGEVWSERLHRGPVTALAAATPGGTAAPGLPLLVSGGFDGVVRLWEPGTEPRAEPTDRRDCPVTAVAVGETPGGAAVVAAWADGLVRVRQLGDPDEVLDLRLGSQVWSLALTGGLLVLGTPDGVAAVGFETARTG
ncbi:hypothetical protein GCM10010193_10640 [Kitasatospora atroaurantiaca]|uniref:WD40 repeat protein n=1 Tax=Kitasatospora atroaurantiaca TaxID=285545 RepID=A0A561ESC5_9ACTN|nr:hypothetical protein [Kitasatospora atroaurantiaca]TWE18512.1 hypothetical protein FB465_3590 [Kitasatospora atroaurantiaca]